jgi:hypothetical protein
MIFSRLSLARIQYVYRLNPLDLASGVIGHRKTLARLTVNDLYTVGRERMTKHRYETIVTSNDLLSKRNIDMKHVL